MISASYGFPFFFPISFGVADTMGSPSPARQHSSAATPRSTHPHRRTSSGCLARKKIWTLKLLVLSMLSTRTTHIYIYNVYIYIYLYICYIYIRIYIYIYVYIYIYTCIYIYQTVNWTFMSSRILIGIEMIFLLLTTVHSALHESRAEVSHNSPLQPGPWDAIFLPGCIDSTKIRII